MTEVFNMDCMQAMAQMKDNEFDLAIVDPVYGDVTKGGYMQNKAHHNSINNKIYHLALWDQKKTGAEYFRELQRVSKNQIVWGGELFHGRNWERLAMLDRMGQRPGRR